MSDRLVLGFIGICFVILLSIFSVCSGMLDFLPSVWLNFVILFVGSGVEIEEDGDLSSSC